MYRVSKNNCDYRLAGCSRVGGLKSALSLSLNNFLTLSECSLKIKPLSDKVLVVLREERGIHKIHNTCNY